MFRIRGSSGIGLLAVVLVLTILILANLDNDDKPMNFRSEAYVPRRDTIHNDRPGPRGLRYPAGEARRPSHGNHTRSASISATRTSWPQPTPTCYAPGLGVPWYDVKVDELCQCDHYMWDDGSALANVGYYGGMAICGAQCVPRNANQTRLANQASGSFSECILACSGSSDKAKAKGKRQDEWFLCYGVNFKKGELCQFIGAIEYPGFTGEKSKGQCWDNGLTPRG